MVKNTNGLSREFIIHPGETLKEILEDRGMSQKELALRTGVTEAHVSSIVNCQKAISVSYAKKLEYALGIDAGFGLICKLIMIKNWLILKRSMKFPMRNLTYLKG